MPEDGPESLSLEDPSAPVEAAEQRATEPGLARQVMQVLSAPHRTGEAIAGLAESRWFVTEDSEIGALAQSMDKDPNITAVGVVDHRGVPRGLVLRQELFDLLGKPYGREFYSRKPVSMVMKEKRVFRDDLSIFAVADMIAADLRQTYSVFYLLADTRGTFTGIFSTRNVLIYLSDITARDLALARRLQAAIVKESLHHAGARTQIACSTSMAKEVGGDFYLVKALGQDKLLVTVCDVSGKGIAASLVTAVLGGMFESYRAPGQMRAFAQSLNRYVYETFRLEHFVTGIIMELDEISGEVTLCDLGHSYLLVADEEGILRLGKEAANPPLGITPDLAPAATSYRIKPGSTLMLFTDGLVDQTNTSGSAYSEQRVWRVFKHFRERSPAQIAQAFAKDLAAFRGDEPQKDDITFVLIRFE